MPYLLDSDVFIRAKRDHYRFVVFPCFWDWLVRKSASGVVHSIQAIERELAVGNDDLATWVAGANGIFLPPDASTTAAAARVAAWVQDPARPYQPQAVATFFAAGDYWLVSHALACGWTVVTHEIPAPASGRRVKIPDVCVGLGVEWTTPFEMLQREGTCFAGS